MRRSSGYSIVTDITSSGSSRVQLTLRARSHHMSSEAGSNVGLIQSIVQTYLGGTAELIVDRSPGYSGSFVYAVDVVSPNGPLPCIIKLIPNWGNDEEITNRVYGSRAASFPAAYALLQQHAIPLP